MPVLLGGDDSVPIPFIETLAARAPLTVIQIDAHIDWRDEVDGERFGFSSTMRRSSEFENVREIIQIGGRGPGSARIADLEAARDWGVKFFFARDIHRHGLGPVLDAIPAGADIVLAVDVDGLDPSAVPGVVPAPTPAAVSTPAAPAGDTAALSPSAAAPSSRTPEPTVPPQPTNSSATHAVPSARIMQAPRPARRRSAPGRCAAA